MKTRKTSRAVAVAVLAPLSAGPMAIGAEFAWNEPAGGDFDDAANWNDGTGSVPDAGDVAIFDVFGNFAVDFDAAWTNDRLIARSGNVFFWMDPGIVYEILGGTAEMPGIVIAERARDLVEIRQTRGVLRAPHVSIGLVPTSAGSLTLGSGYSDDSRFEADCLRLGDGGTGQLRMTEAATALIGRAELGVAALGYGDLRTNGPDIAFTVENDLVIAAAGVANVTVEDVGSFAAGSILLGRDPGGVGRLIIERGNTVAVAGDVEAGRDGVGIVEVEGGASIEIGGALTARTTAPVNSPILIVLNGFTLATAPIAVAGDAFVDGVELLGADTHEPALDDEYLLITAASGLAGTPVTGTELPAGLVWQISATDDELRARVIIDPRCEPGPGEDCNGNGVRDDCDLILGTSLDCNANELPDECDIAGKTSVDCNGNGVPDECDVADGTSDDCDNNGVPDDCTSADVGSLLDAFGAAGDGFGGAVDVDGPYAVVGSPDASPPFVTVFEQRGTRWVRAARLRAPGGASGDGFGRTVGIGGSTVVVGAPTADDGGVAYVFERAVSGQWTETAMLGIPPTPSIVDGFGTSVDANGLYVVVGGRWVKDAGDIRGIGFIYERSNAWALRTTFFTPRVWASALPGPSVGIGDNVAALLWPGESELDRGLFAAVEYVDTLTVWLPRTVLPPEGIVVGPDIAVDDDAIAARIESDGFRGVGIARPITTSKYRFDTYLEQPGGDSFGRTLGISDGRLAAGASADGAAGRVYAYRQVSDEVWQADETLETTSAGPIGFAVELDGGRLITGAPTDDAGGADAGAAWIADLPGPDCNANGVRDVCDLLDGTSMDQDGDGVPDECADTCPYDMDESGGIGFNDLLIVLASWGTCPNCLADVNGSGSVGFLELGDLLQAWGDCP